ncbi:MAG: cytochrome b N-terminal domain-containing protein [Clostridia bacterium]|nr:cytochrome b N-terminal domain-containing protein [Clostridia bacterium]
MWAKIYDWIDERLEIKEQVKDILAHPVPPHVNWLYCFGGITFVLIMIQVITGIFLTMYYVPSPDHAFASVEYISKEVAYGKLIRGMHRVGSSAVVVMVVVHMLRVFMHGAYKKPREMNWVVGVLLLLIVLTLGFTGYLLPWDQKAYWATVVGTKMAAAVPGMGEFILKALRGGSDLGAVTLTRFYSMHIWLLPGALLGLLGAHFFMIRKQGISGPL